MDLAFQNLTFQNAVWTRNMTALQIMRLLSKMINLGLNLSYILPKSLLIIFMTKTCTLAEFCHLLKNVSSFNGN